MPTYQYTCTDCGHDLEAVQKFSDDPLTECPTCTGKLRKVFSAVGVVFKGSGFYRTDSRAKSSAADAPAKSGAPGESGGEKSPAKAEPAPATKSEAASSSAKKSTGGESAA